MLNQPITRLARFVVPPAILLAVIVIATVRGEAHKPITSPYTYNEEVFPILRDRCGRCHVSGGVAPMSLMTYKDAFPWGESIRTELVAGHMPPGGVDDAAGRFRNAATLTARELNILLTWVTGGNPMGSAERMPSTVEPRRGWRLGPPDLVVQMPSDFTLAADTNDATQEFTLPIDATGDRLIRAVDLLPGNPAIVRSATVSVKAASSGGAEAFPTGGGRPAAAAADDERLLAMWTPGDDPVPLDIGMAFHVPASAALALRIHYKKTWQYERSPMTDRTSVGLYFASAPAAAVRALVLSAPGVGRTDGGTNVRRTVSGQTEARRTDGAQTDGARPDGGRTVSGPASPDQISFSQKVGDDVQAVAIYPDAALENASLEVRAVRPDGSRAELIRVRPQADWTRRYWFAQPVPLPRGTQIDVVATLLEPLLPPGAAPVVPRRPDPSSLRLTLNVIPAR